MVGLGTKDGLSLMPAQDIESSFPKLRKERYEIASEETTDYNCFAWAAHDTTDCGLLCQWLDTIGLTEYLES